MAGQVLKLLLQEKEEASDARNTVSTVRHEAGSAVGLAWQLYMGAMMSDSVRKPTLERGWFHYRTKIQSIPRIHHELLTKDRPLSQVLKSRVTTCSAQPRPHGYRAEQENSTWPISSGRAHPGEETSI